MEIIQASWGVYCSTLQLRQLQPCKQDIHYNYNNSSSPRYCKYSQQRRGRWNAAAPSFTNTKWESVTPTVTTTPIPRALLDDSASDFIATKVPVDDLALAVKKRAVEIGPELRGSSIFLLGMNSSLKSSLGKLLADGLRYYYFESDNLVEEAIGGRLAAKSLVESDEKGFRDAETEVLKQLSSMGRLVVSAGNGAVQCATNLALLRHGISIWIDVPLDMVAREVVDDRIQLPELEMSISGSYSEVLTQLTALYKERQNGYATADASISLQKVASQLGYDALETVTTEDMALEVLKAVERLVRVKKMMEEAARPF